MSLLVKSSIITHLEGDAGVTLLVPASRIFAMQAPSLPEWPFIRYGSTISTPYEASCWSGSVCRVTIHAFAETDTAGAGEDKAHKICSAIVKSVKDFRPDGFGIVENEWLLTNVIRDGQEADKWHGIVEFSITAVLP